MLGDVDGIQYSMALLNATVCLQSCGDLLQTHTLYTHAHMLTLHHANMLSQLVLLLQPCSKWWQNIVKGRQGSQGGIPKEEVGKMSFEAVPACPGFFWATDDRLRLIGSGGQGAVYW